MTYKNFGPEDITNNTNEIYVLTDVTMKVVVAGDRDPCSLVTSYQRFGETSSLIYR
jgi:hypothetical protein